MAGRMGASVVRRFLSQSMGNGQRTALPALSAPSQCPKCSTVTNSYTCCTSWSCRHAAIQGAATPTLRNSCFCVTSFPPRGYRTVWAGMLQKFILDQLVTWPTRVGSYWHFEREKKWTSQLTDDSECLARFKRVHKTKPYFRCGWALLGPTLEWQNFLWKRLTHQMTHLLTSSQRVHFQCFLMSQVRHGIVYPWLAWFSEQHTLYRKSAPDFTLGISPNKHVKRLGTGTPTASANLQQNVLSVSTEGGRTHPRRHQDTKEVIQQASDLVVRQRKDTREVLFTETPQGREDVATTDKSLITLRTSLQKAVEDWHKREVLTDVWLKMSKNGQVLCFCYWAEEWRANGK